MFKLLLVLGVAHVLSAEPSVSDALKSGKDLIELYRAFKARTSDGTLRSSAELPARLRLFRKSLETIEEINNQNLGWKAGLTLFADMSAAEVQQYSGVNGTVVDEPTVPTLSSRAHPSSLDWRKKGAVSGVKHQGNSMACWTYSTVGVLEGLYKKTSGKLIEFADQELMDCVYEGTSHSGSNGGWPQEAMRYLEKKRRIAHKAHYKSTGRDGRCIANTKSNALAGYQAYGTRHLAKNDAAVVAALNQSPVGVVFGVTSYSSHYSGGLYYDPSCRTSQFGLHAVPAIGYTPQAFIIKNSYGTSWGIQGYGHWKRGWTGCDFFEYNYTFSLRRASGEEEEE